MSNLLSVEGIDVRYGEVVALEGVSVAVAPGEVIAILGGNASGKSTTVKSILGLVRPARGTIVYDGERIDGRPTPEIVERGIGSIPEGRRVFAGMSVEENLLMGAFVRRRDRNLADALIAVYERFPRLRERRTQPAGTLSGGEQQMLALGRAWMRRPRLLCIDEPSMGLAPRAVSEVYDVLRAWKAEGLSMVVVEQQADLALALADRAYILRQGRIVLSGPARDLARDPAVQAAYLGG